MKVGLAELYTNAFMYITLGPGCCLVSFSTTLEGKSDTEKHIMFQIKGKTQVYPPKYLIRNYSILVLFIHSHGKAFI